MSHDIYTGYSGASAAWKQLEALSHDLSNASTTGYKRSRMAFELAGPQSENGQMYVRPTELSYDMSAGAIQRDQDPNHLALTGEGFFVVDVNGRELLTRNGDFSLTDEGALVTADGHEVQGQGGPIQIPVGEAMTVGPDGTVYGSLSGEIDRLKVVASENLEPAGGARYLATGPTTEVETPSVLQGALESSNTDPLSLMVELVEISRLFEMYQKSMQASDEMDTRMNRSGGK